MLQNEASLASYASNYPIVQPGYLISLLEKALILLQYESHLNEEVNFYLEYY